jgi:hypothetical protein
MLHWNVQLDTSVKIQCTRISLMYMEEIGLQQVVKREGSAGVSTALYSLSTIWYLCIQACPVPSSLWASVVLINSILPFDRQSLSAIYPHAPMTKLAVLQHFNYSRRLSCGKFRYKKTWVV